MKTQTKQGADSLQIKSVKEEQFEKYKGIVFIALQEMPVLLPNGMEKEDVIQYGYLGLLEAAERYEKNFGSFSHYAYIRVRGAMMDGLVEYQWFKRSQIRDRLRWQEAEQYLQEKLGRSVRDEEVAQHLQLTPELGRRWQRLASTSVVYSESLPGAETKRLCEDSVLTWQYEMEELEEKNILEQALRRLNKAEQELVYAYYFCCKSLKEFAAEKHISRNWASSLHRKVLGKLRRWMGA